MRRPLRLVGITTGNEGPESDSKYLVPVFVCGHGSTKATGCAITGGAFYNPTTRQFPSGYVGDYFFADFCSGWIRRLDAVPGDVSGFATELSRPVALKVSNGGNLYYLSTGAGAGSVAERFATQAPRRYNVPHND